MRHLVVVLCLLSASPARAQDVPDGINVNPWVALAITGVAIGGTIALTQIPVPYDDTVVRPVSEMLGFDLAVRGRISSHASSISNATLIGALTLPMIAHISLGTDGAGDSMLTYAEVLSSTILFNTAVKRLARRARPYTFNEEVLARRRGEDNFLSFYSGHSAASFAAATTAGMTFAMRTEVIETRALVWAAGLSLASATAVFRVRAGSHYPTDVLIGALAGILVGGFFPLINYTGQDGHLPQPEEIGAMGAGLLGGALIAYFWPLADWPPVKVIPVATGGAAAVLSLDELPIFQ